MGAKGVGLGGPLNPAPGTLEHGIGDGHLKKAPLSSRKNTAADRLVYGGAATEEREKSSKDGYCPQPRSQASLPWTLP